MITREQHAHIRRLFHAEHWTVGTIAKELGLHSDTVKRAIEVERFGVTVDAPRPSVLDPYKPFVLSVLEKHPSSARRAWCRCSRSAVTPGASRRCGGT